MSGMGGRIRSRKLPAPGPPPQARAARAVPPCWCRPQSPARGYKSLQGTRVGPDNYYLNQLKVDVDGVPTAIFAGKNLYIDNYLID